MRTPILFFTTRLCWIGLCVAICLPLAARADAVEDFFRATEFNDADAVGALLQQGVNPNAGERYHGYTALMVALFEGSMKVFRVLVDAPGIDLEARANNGNNALMIAAIKGNQSAFDVLLQKGAAINRPGWTALHYAATSGSDAIVRTLLDRGADIDARSPNRTTPLMMAIYGGHFSTAELLLDRGADITLKNALGMDAAEFARQGDRRDMIALVADRQAQAATLQAESGYGFGFSFGQE
jgi:ankyrin repeat protein